ncbi:type II toxin-antitoxin system HicA family toxin [Pleurocapsales cyanobacterium LEGE 10410]|nr:type II toxin-antitoxin system HicA family toxin [Pleurocapsales cyanobacterium LEGE 10410]
MKSISGKKFAKLLEHNGWVLLRVNGSQVIFYGKSGNAQRISVPVHGNKALKTGLLRHFLKVSGIPEDEL